jgi:hypothetical protein
LLFSGFLILRISRNVLGWPTFFFVVVGLHPIPCQTPHAHAHVAGHRSTSKPHRGTRSRHHTENPELPTLKLNSLTSQNRVAKGFRLDRYGWAGRVSFQEVASWRQNATFQQLLLAPKIPDSIPRAPCAVYCVQEELKNHDAVHGLCMCRVKTFCPFAAPSCSGFEAGTDLVDCS